MGKLGGTADQIFVGAFVIAIVAVVVGSGRADTLINGVSTLLVSLIKIIVSPQTGN